MGWSRRTGVAECLKNLLLPYFIGSIGIDANDILFSIGFDSMLANWILRNARKTTAPKIGPGSLTRFVVQILLFYGLIDTSSDTHSTTQDHAVWRLLASRSLFQFLYVWPENIPPQTRTQTGVSTVFKFSTCFVVLFKAVPRTMEGMSSKMRARTNIRLVLLGTDSVT